MTAQRVRFRQDDLTKAIRALRVAGLELGRIEIDPDGLITVFPSQSLLPKRPTGWEDF